MLENMFVCTHLERRSLAHHKLKWWKIILGKIYSMANASSFTASTWGVYWATLNCAHVQLATHWCDSYHRKHSFYSLLIFSFRCVFFVIHCVNGVRDRKKWMTQSHYGKMCSKRMKTICRLRQRSNNFLFFFRGFNWTIHWDCTECARG